jgi:diguanylate cyclase (GGDEF)-like protein/PAS domain S-box-containing protein
MPTHRPPRPFWLACLLCALLTFMLLPLARAQGSLGEPLTEAERAYLAGRGPIVFISQTHYPPFEFIDPETTLPKGMMIELAQWIATEFGFHATFTDAVFINAQQAVLDGRADVLTSLFYSEERDARFDFTQTVYEIPASIFVAADRPDIASLDDLEGKRIALQRGDYAESYLRARGLEFNLVPTADFSAAADAVLGAQADALIGDEQIVLHALYSKGRYARMKKVGAPLYVGLNAMAVREGHAELRSILDKGIARAREDGTLDRIAAKWLGTGLAAPRFELRAYWPHAAAALALVLLGLLWNLRLRQAVRSRTAQLEGNKLRLEGIIEGTRAGTWEWRVGEDLIVINDLWAAMLGYRREELEPLTRAGRLALIHPDDRDRCTALMNKHMAGDCPDYACEVRMRHKDGHWLWMQERGKITERSPSGAALTVSGIQIDVSASKYAQIELQLTASVFQYAREGIAITNADGVILDVNPAFTRITGYGRDEAIGQNPRILKSDHHDPSFYRALWRSVHDKGFWEGEIWNRRKSGEVYPEILTVSVVRDEKGKISHYVAVFSDISRQKEYERQLERMAFFDDLTGLPNRVLLVDRLGQAMARSRRNATPLSLAYLDLDGFKEINDSHGHALGDRVLTTIAERLGHILREEDTVARFGGDEFVIVLPDPTSDQTQEAVVRRVLGAIAEPIHIGHAMLQVSASIGLVHYVGESDLDSDQLIRQADQAMYQAKQAGKNRVHVFDAELDRAVRGRHESIARIRRGLEDGEFVLHYQPKVHLREGTLVGVEALVRWLHPERGLLPPATFLPDIETHRAGVELGEWVILAALAQIAQWRRQGLNLTVSVNIAAHHLQQPNFVERLSALLATHPSVPPRCLELEVLETSALEDVELVSTVMARCAALGVHFALDDFGTGYSTLIYLKRLPVKVLKIDQGFVRDMLHDPDDLSILEGVLGLARAFHRDAIAEGVETEAHGKLLIQLGCEHGQGYGIARPMPAEALREWVRQWRAPAAWRQARRLPQRDVELLYAATEHRAWMLRLESYLRNMSAEPPELAHEDCRFGQWLEGHRGQAGVDSPFDQIDALHQKMHQLAQQLVAQPGPVNPHTLEALRHASQALLGGLHALIDTRSGAGTQ